MTDPVVAALRAALAAGDSADLRFALGSHLLGTGSGREALAEFEAALVLRPAHVPTLEAAARAAAAAGDEPRAGAYRLAASSLGAATASASASATVPVVPSETRSSGESPVLRLVEGGAEPSEASAPPPITFADVAGMDAVKQRLTRSVLIPMRNPALNERYSRSLGGGLVLYGPPGVGKTWLARAMAGEVNARFVDVSLSDVLDMWFGESERQLHALIDNARRQAPAVVFFDELDALGHRRTQLKGSAGRTLVNQLLLELDGAGSRNDGVFFLGATNHPWDLDTALRRPGRFDRLVFVPPPDLPARLRLLELKLAGLPAVGLDLSAVARGTDGYSGADLTAIVDDATEVALERAVRVGREVPIDQAMLLDAMRARRPSTRAWFETARNYARYANEGGVYDDLLAHLKGIGLG